MQSVAFYSPSGELLGSATFDGDNEIVHIAVTQGCRAHVIAYGEDKIVSSIPLNDTKDFHVPTV